MVEEPPKTVLPEVSITIFLELFVYTSRFPPVDPVPITKELPDDPVNRVPPVEDSTPIIPTLEIPFQNNVADAAANREDFNWSIPCGLLTSIAYPGTETPIPNLRPLAS